VTTIELATINVARERASRIRASLSAMQDGISALIEAYNARDWATLGYDSWGEYLECENLQIELRGLPRDERSVIIAAFREDAGMSTRAIAAATGLSQKTVSRNTVAGESFDSPEPKATTGMDGKSYSPPKPRPVADIPEAANLSQDDLDELNGALTPPIEPDDDPDIDAEVEDGPIPSPTAAAEQTPEVQGHRYTTTATFTEAFQAFFALSHDDRHRAIGVLMSCHPDAVLAAVASVSAPVAEITPPAPADFHAAGSGGAPQTPGAALFPLGVPSRGVVPGP
jgi:hypothetical protein